MQLVVLIYHMTGASEVSYFTLLTKTISKTYQTISGASNLHVDESFSGFLFISEWLRAFYFLLVQRRLWTLSPMAGKNIIEYLIHRKEVGGLIFNEKPILIKTISPYLGP